MAEIDHNVDLDQADERINAGREAGDNYVNDLESIRDDLDKTDNSGTTLGTMVSSQLKMTEAETRYMIRAGIPKKVASVVQAVANDVKKGGG